MSEVAVALLHRLADTAMSFARSYEELDACGGSASEPFNRDLIFCSFYHYCWISRNFGDRFNQFTLNIMQNIATPRWFMEPEGCK